MNEITALRHEIESICIAMKYAYGCVGSHMHIMHKNQILRQKQKELATHVGEKQSFEEVLDALDRQLPSKDLEGS